MKNRRKSIALLTAGIILCSGVLAGCGGKSETKENSSSEKFTFRIGAGHVVENITWTTAMEEYFVPTVTEKAKSLGYEIEWVKSYGGSVAKLGEALEAVEGGILDFTYVNYGFEPSTLKIHNIDFRVPFTCPDPEVVSKAAAGLFDKYPDEFRNAFQKYNQTSLGIGVTDNYCIYSTKPIESVEDLKGMKIGGGASYLYWLENTGATAVQSSLNDGYTSMQTGVYDAMICPLGSAYGMKLYEVAPYVILTDFGSKMAGSLTVNNDTLNGLPEDLKDVILETGAGYTEAEAKLTAEKYASDLEGLKEAGATIIQLSDAEKERWVEVIPNVVQSAVDEFNEAGYQTIEIYKAYWEELGKNGYDMVIDWELQ